MLDVFFVCIAILNTYKEFSCLLQYRKYTRKYVTYYYDGFQHVHRPGQQSAFGCLQVVLHDFGANIVGIRPLLEDGACRLVKENLFGEMKTLLGLR